MVCECDKMGYKIANIFRRNRVKSIDKKLAVERKRSFMKGCTWEFMCFFILGSMVYYLTGKWEDVTFVVAVYHGCKVVLYYFHERAWAKSKWGMIE
jgi:uncharacterized membrane protein